MTGPAGLYARVSTDEQAEHGTSLEAQLAECEAYARQRGHIPCVPYVDAGWSGTTLDRPALERLRADVARGRVARVVCYDPDRLSRNLGHLLSLVDEFALCGVDVEFTNFAMNPSPDGRLLFALRGAIAEFETHKIRQRMTAGKLARAREGRPVGGGHQIYGYHYDKAQKRFVAEPSEAVVVHHIFRLAEELGTHAIAARLNAAGLRAKHGGPWSQTSVYGILRNPTYLGRMAQMHGAGHVAVPALIDAATFARATATLTARRNRPPGPARHAYLLSGRARCGVCGRHMVGGHGRKGRTGYVGRYSCTGKRSRPACPSTYYRVDAVDAAVWRAVTALLNVASPAAIAAAGSDADGAPAPAPAADAAQRSPEAAPDCDRQRQRLWRAYRAGLIDDAALADQLREVAALEALTAARPAPQATTANSPDATHAVATALAAAAAATDPIDRRLVLATLGLEAILGPGGHARLRFAPPSPGRPET